MKVDTLKISAMRLAWDETIQLAIMTADRKNYMFEARFQKREDGVAIPSEALMRMEIRDAQSLMDELWDCGIRPTSGAGSAGAMTMAQEQIKSLRDEISHLRNVNWKMLQKLTEQNGETENG